MRRILAVVCAASCACSAQAVAVRALPDGSRGLYVSGAAEPFAVLFGDPADTDVRLRAELSSPFVFFEVSPKACDRERIVRRMDLPRLTLRPFAVKPKAMSYAGLTEVGGHSGALGFLAVAEPRTRRGVVAAWLTNERASGVIGSGFAPDGRVTLSPFAEYGRMRVPAGAAVAPDVFVVGAFDDCRLGLEAYADTVRRHYAIALPPQIAGYTTWYPDRFGYSDRSRFPRGCGAGDADSTRLFAEAVERLGLGAYGFSFFQIDDQWQCGEELLDSPARDFSRVNPKGPYPDGLRPTADFLAAKGIRSGLWWMPFGGMSCDPWWADKSNLFVRAAADVRNVRSPSLPQRADAPLETLWGGTCLDMTRPEARRYVAETTRRMTVEWGMRYIKYDGMWTGYACDLLGGKSHRDDHFDNARFFDDTVPNIAAYRLGVRTMREAATPDTFILGCNIAQNARSIVASYGLADAMRIGGDNGPIDMFPERYLAGPVSATTLYFLNGRTWYNDPDPVYVRSAVPFERAKMFASYTALAGALYNFSDWLPDLPAERVDVLKRTMAPHGRLSVRPVDYFENRLPQAWVLDAGETKVFGFFNWKTNETLSVDWPAVYAGFDAGRTYAGFDYWAGRPIPSFRDRLVLTVPPDSCRLIAVRPCDTGRPVVVSTSRHVASPVLDVREEDWDARRLELSGVSRTVPGDPYELRLYLPAGIDCVAVSSNLTFRQEGSWLRLACRPTSETLSWRVSFRRLPRPVHSADMVRRNSSG